MGIGREEEGMAWGKREEW
jgi:hypothetical protein